MEPGCLPLLMAEAQRGRASLRGLLGSSSFNRSEAAEELRLTSTAYAQGGRGLLRS